MYTTLLLVTSLWALTLAHDVILKPPTSGPAQIGLIMIQGAQIPADRYIPLAQAIQSAPRLPPVWVGIPDFPLSTPEPLVIGSGISRVLKAMQAQGMNTSAKLFFTGHSIGGIILQDYLAESPSGAVAQVLMGSFLQRKYRNDNGLFPITTLTIGGELDGLCHVTRIMEEYYHTKSYKSGSYVMVMKGVSHIQFASGEPPELVKLRDLRPEVTMEEAHQNIATLVSAYISMTLSLGDPMAQEMLAYFAGETFIFMKPLITAYELEGFYNFHPPCYKNSSVLCTNGSAWSEYAQEVMGGLPTGRVRDADVFHPVYQINPVHLPHVLNTTNCSTPNEFCTVTTTTVSQNVYEEFDKLIDAGFVPTSASEIRVKLKSRQVVLEAGGYKNEDFNKTDGSSLCKSINQLAYNWALRNASADTVARFNKYGVPMVMGEDKEALWNIGPAWIWCPLSYTKKKSQSGQDVLEVQSVTMRTPKDYRIKAAAGMHYCKLLSPARALEWLYVDGLRDHYNING